jgi:hypothetical protein
MAHLADMPVRSANVPFGGKADVPQGVFHKCTP